MKDRLQILKWPALIVALLAALWAMSPSRSLPDTRRGDLVEITYMGPGGPIAGAQDSMVRAFERWSEEQHRKDPRQPVYRVVSGQNAAYDQVADPTRFLISVAGGMPPDVIYFDRYAIAEWASRNAFENLDPYIEADIRNNVPDAVKPEDYYKSCWDEAMYKGHIYGIPLGVDDRALFYNKDLLKQAGFVDPKTGEALPPRTWDELRDVSRKLTRKNEFNQLAAVGFAPNYGNSWFYMFSWMAGGEFMSPDGRTVTLTAPENVRALQYMLDLYNDLGGYQAVQAFSAGFQGGQLDPFIQGKVAMKIDGSWQMGFMAQYGRDLDFGIAPPPMPADRLGAGVKPISWNGGWAYAIPYNAHKKQAAWEFIRFAMSDEGCRIFAEGERENADALGFPYIPSLSPKIRVNQQRIDQYVNHNPRIPDRVKDGLNVFLELLPDAKFRPVTPVGQLLWNQHISAMEEALYQRKGPKDALAYAQNIVQRDLDRFFEPPTGARFNANWFFVAYGIILTLTIAGVYLWDTQTAFRRRVARMFGRRKEIGVGDLVEGARGGYFRSQWLGGFLCALPWIVGFVVFGGGPLLFSIVMSFCDYDVLSPARYIGLKNFKIMFFEDELAYKAMWNTVYMLITIPLSIVLSLAVALLLNLKLQGMRYYRTLFYLPAIVPAVATFMLWMWVFNPAAGPLNGILKLFGFAGKAWLTDESLSKPSLVIMAMWGVGGGMIIWLAGLRGIGEQLYEAAAIDGANTWQQFRHITIPMLSPYIFFNMIMGLIGGFQRFDEAFIMTHGGPINSTLFYVYHLFNNAFRYGHMGYASALAWVLFVIILGFTIIQMRLASKWVHYESE